METFRNACDADVFAELVRLNALDLELVNRARAEVHRRFSHGSGRADRACANCRRQSSRG